jgi:hypothetical protein
MEGRTMSEDAMRKHLKKLQDEFKRQLELLQSGAASTQRNGRNATAATIAHLKQRILETSKILQAVDKDDSPRVRPEEPPSLRDLVLMKMEQEQQVSAISKIVEKAGDEAVFPETRLEKSPSFRELVLRKMKQKGG